MKAILRERLFALDEQYRNKRTVADKQLRVYYGWAKTGKIRKKEAISVIFENDVQSTERTMRFINKMMDVVYVRDQTKGERQDAIGRNRMFAEYSIFLCDKQFQGSLTLAVKENSNADKNNVSKEERTVIAEKLTKHYLDNHPEYKEPVIQTLLEFE